MWLFALKRDSDGSLITPDEYIEYANKNKTEYKNDKKVFVSAEDGNKIFTIGTCINSKLFLDNLRSHYDDYNDTKETLKITKKKLRDYKKNDANIDFLNKKMEEIIIEKDIEIKRILNETRFHNEDDIMNSPEVYKLKLLLSNNQDELNTIPSLHQKILGLKLELRNKIDIEAKLNAEYNQKITRLKKKLDKEAMDTANKLYGNDLKDQEKKYKKLQAKYKQARIDLLQAQSETSDDD